MNEETIREAQQIISRAHCLITFSGAGLSSESGIATFRDAKTGGLWTKHDPTRLASPEGFAEDPKLVIDWYAARRKTLSEAEPNPAHRALARRTDITHITQNVDDLLHRAGGRPENIIQLHGTIATDRCHGSCGYEESIALSNPPSLRDCPNCGAPMRPGVVWFGETLPPEAWRRAEDACARCDVMLVIGTSAEVYPAAGLIGLAKSSKAKIIIVNTEPSGASHLAEVELIGKAGEIVPGLLAGPE